MSKYERQAFPPTVWNEEPCNWGSTLNPDASNKKAADQIHIECWSAAMPGKWQLMLRT